MADDLRALIGAKLLQMAREYHEASDLDVDFDEAAARVSGSWIVDGVMAVVQPELDRRDKRIEEYRESRRRWMEAAYADRRASESVGEELRAALTALQAVREAQSLGEALAAVAKHDGLTTIQPTTKE